MIIRLRRFGTHSAVALALAGLTASGPVQAVEFHKAVPVEIGAPVDFPIGDDIPPAIVAPARPEAAAPTEEAAPGPVLEPIGEGEASYYGHELAGNRTASGERFDPNGLTAAHRSLPLGTRLKVTNKANGKTVVVRINDRGPFVRHRILDVSLGAAKKLQMVRAGKARVSMAILRSA